VIYPYQRPRYIQTTAEPPPKRARTEVPDPPPDENVAGSNSAEEESGTCIPIDSVRKYSTTKSYLLNTTFDFNSYTMAAYTNSTWKRLDSAWTSLKHCEKFLCKKFEWPLSEENITHYCNWALEKKNLSPKTVKAYLSCLATISKLDGKSDASCKTFKVNSILRGAENLANESPVSKRLAMTLPSLKLLGHEIAKSNNWANFSKQVIWTACCVSFFGSLRMGEILCLNEHKFDSTSTLLWGDLSIREDSWTLHIKKPKSRSCQGEFVDIFKFPGNNCCPVKALKVLKSMSKSTKKHMPVFMFENGKLLTKNIFNETIRGLLKNTLGQKAELFSGHSFRAGIPSAIAKSKNVNSETMAKSWGRWHSDSYQRYMRLKLDQRKILFNKICDVLNCCEI
jgi:hypothetical protein